MRENIKTEISTDDLTEEKGIENKEDEEKSQKTFDDSCFKTPMLPHKRNALALKKRQTASNFKSHSRSGLQSAKTETLNNEKTGRDMSKNLSRLSFEQTSTEDSCELDNSAKENNKFLDVFVSIGKNSYLCPRTRHFIATEFPNLPQKRPSNEEEDLLKEIIIDEFSLLLFTTIDDYNILKMHEEKQKERENAKEKQRIYEENLRLGKIKKKGRKLKTNTEKDFENELKEIKERKTLERHEIHSLRKEQKKLQKRKKLERYQNLNIEERLVEKKREKKETQDKKLSSNEDLLASTSNVVLNHDEIPCKNNTELSKDEIKEIFRKKDKRLKRDKKLTEKKLKQQLKSFTTLNIKNLQPVVNNNTYSDVLTFVPSVKILDSPNFSSNFITPTTTTLSSLFCKTKTFSFNVSSNSDINNIKNVQSTALSNHNFENVPNSVAAALFGLNACSNGVSGTFSNTMMTVGSMNDWSMLKDFSAVQQLQKQENDLIKTECNNVASTSASHITNNSISNSNIKRPSSAIEIVSSKNGIISSPINNLESKNLILITPPANKIRKIESEIDGFISQVYSLQQKKMLSNMASDSNEKLLTMPTISSSNSLLSNKQKAKGENNHVTKNNSSNKNALTNSNQRSTPFSKETFSSLNVNNNTSSPNVNNVFNFSSFSSPLISTSTTAAIASTSNTSKSTSINIQNTIESQQLLNRLTNVNFPAINVNTSISNEHLAGNLITQSIFLNQPELASLLNLQLPTQQLQSQDALQQQQALFTAAAAVGLPFFNMLPSILSQQQQQQDELQKQDCLFNLTKLAENNDNALKFEAANSLVNGLNSLSNLNNNYNAVGNLSMASQLAGVAMLGKTPIVANSKPNLQKSNGWSNKHASIALKIGKIQELQNNILPLKAQQNQLNQNSKLKFQDQKLQQSSQSQNNLGNFDPLTLFGANFMRQNNITSNLNINTALPIINNKNLLNNHVQINNNFTPLSGTSLNLNVSQKRPNLVSSNTSASANIPLTKQQFEQQKQQQLFHMAAIKQQNVQQQLQLDTIRKFQQQQIGIGQQQNLLTQLHQQQLAQLHQPQKIQPTSTSANSATSMRLQTPGLSQLSLPSSSITNAAIPNKHIFSPSALLNASLFYSNNSKLPVNGNLSILPETSLSQKSLSNATMQFSNTSTNNFLPTTSLALNSLNLSTNSLQQLHQNSIPSSVSTQSLNTLNFGAAPSTLFSGNLSVSNSSYSAQTNSTNSQAQDAVLAAALNTPLGLSQIQNPLSQNKTASFAQMAMAQLMMQQLTNVSTASLSNLQSTPQFLNNNFLANFGLLPPNSTSQLNLTLPTVYSNEIACESQLQNLQGSQTSGNALTSIPSSTATVAATGTPNNRNNILNLQQQQQEFLLQAALLQGIQSLETKSQQQQLQEQQQKLPHKQLNIINSNNNTVSTALNTAIQQQANSTDLFRQQQQLLFVQQLQQQQKVFLDRINIAENVDENVISRTLF